VLTRIAQLLSSCYRSIGCWILSISIKDYPILLFVLLNAGGKGGNVRVHYLSCRTFPFTAITAMSTLAKRSKNWSANDTAELSSESETGREQDREPQFGSVHDAQLKLQLFPYR
jgi:hypothetical protein